MEETLINRLKDILSESTQYHLKVQPTTHVRVTQGDRWIFASTDEYLKSYDKKKGARTFNRKMQLVRSNECRKEIAWVCKRDGFKLDTGNYIIIFMKHMPKTWKKGKRKPGKRDIMAWQPMCSQPDIDNFYKRTSDSLLSEDKGVWCTCLIKLWIPDEVEEGTYFINAPTIFDSIVSFIKDKLS